MFSICLAAQFDYFLDRLEESFCLYRMWDVASSEGLSISSDKSNRRLQSKQYATPVTVKSVDASTSAKPKAKGPSESVLKEKQLSTNVILQFKKAKINEKISNLVSPQSSEKCIAPVDKDNADCFPIIKSNLVGSGQKWTALQMSKANMKINASTTATERSNSLSILKKRFDHDSLTSIETPDLSPILPRYRTRGFFGYGKKYLEATEFNDTSKPLSSKLADHLANVECDGTVVREKITYIEDDSTEMSLITMDDVHHALRSLSPVKPKSVPNPRIEKNRHIPLEYPKSMRSCTSTKTRLSIDELSRLKRGESGDDFLDKEARCRKNGFPKRYLGLHMFPRAKENSIGEEVDAHGRYLVHYHFSLGNNVGPPPRILGCTYSSEDRILKSSNFAEEVIVVSHEVQFENTEHERHVWRAIGTETFEGVLELTPQMFNPQFPIDIGTWFSAILEYAQVASDTGDCAKHLRIADNSHLYWLGETPNSEARECYNGSSEWLQVKARLLRSEKYSPYMKSDRYGFVCVPEKVLRTIYDVSMNLDFYDGWIQPLREPIIFEFLSRRCLVCWEAVSVNLVASVTPEEMPLPF